MKTALKLTVFVVVLLLTFGAGWLASGVGIGRAADPESLSERERRFTERMQNVVLVGHFTLEGQERRDGLPERYEISKVTRLDGDRWRFDARVVYANVDVTVPVVVPMLWAGDTPMVTLTDVSLPGLGEGFSARVLFYDERYAGTWDHGEQYGGLMYGTIESM
jgi:hypothetical protein